MLKRTFTDSCALGIVVESPQPDEGSARTCNG